jgi:hypothetical protein
MIRKFLLGLALLALAFLTVTEPALAVASSAFIGDVLTAAGFAAPAAATHGPAPIVALLAFTCALALVVAILVFSHRRGRPGQDRSELDLEGGMFTICGEQPLIFRAGRRAAPPAVPVPQ